MTLNHDEAKAEAKLFMERINSNDFYHKLNLKWRAWFSKKDKIMGEILPAWYIRCYTPRNGDPVEIDIDDPVPLQGDVIAFLRIGSSEPYEMAENVAKQIEDYAEENHDKYEPALRIRSVIFQTASAYAQELVESASKYEALFGIDSLTDAEIANCQAWAKEVKDEIAWLHETIDDVMLCDRIVRDDQALKNTWMEISDMCKRWDGKMIESIEELSKEKQLRLTKPKGE